MTIVLATLLGLIAGGGMLMLALMASRQRALNNQVARRIKVGGAVAFLAVDRGECRGVVVGAWRPNTREAIDGVGGV